MVICRMSSIETEKLGLPKRAIFIREVEKRTGSSRQTIWRWVRSGKFPPPSKIGNRNAWLESVIDQWLDDMFGHEDQNEG